MGAAGSSREHSENLPHVHEDDGDCDCDGQGGVDDNRPAGNDRSIRTENRVTIS